MTILQLLTISRVKVCRELFAEYGWPHLRPPEKYWRAKWIYEQIRITNHSVLSRGLRLTGNEVDFPLQ